MTQEQKYSTSVGKLANFFESLRGSPTIQNRPKKKDGWGPKSKKKEIFWRQKQLWDGLLKEKTRITGEDFVELEKLLEEVNRDMESKDIEPLSESEMEGILSAFESLRRNIRDKRIEGERGKVDDFTFDHPMSMSLFKRGLNAMIGFDFFDKQQVMDRISIAMDFFDLILTFNPHHKESLVRMGDCYGVLGNTLKDTKKLEKALECTNKALEIDPEFYPALVAKGSYYLNKDSLGEAIKYYDRAISINDEYKDAWEFKGFALKKLKRKKESREWLKKAKKLQWYGINLTKQQE